MKTKTINLESMDVEIKKITYGKLKKTVLKLTKMFTAILEKAEDEKTASNDLIGVIQPVLENHLPEVEDLLKDFTNLDDGKLDELYIEDMITLLKELLIYNGMNMSRLLGFFQKVQPTMQNPVYPVNPMGQANGKLNF